MYINSIRMKIIYDLTSDSKTTLREENEFLILSFYKKKALNKILEKRLFNTTTVYINGKYKSNSYIEGLYTVYFLIPDTICVYNTQTNEDIKKYIFYLDKRNILIKKYLQLLEK